MALDLYSPCPCGSGKKFKWCCQPIHVQIDKAFRHDQEGQHEAALRLFDQVTAEHPANPEAWGRKAQLLYQNGRLDEAEQALQKAFDINPTYPYGYLLRGLFRQHEGEIAGSLLLFRKAAELYDPDAKDILAQIYTLIADAELKLHRPVAAHAAAEIALRLRPGDELRQNIDQLFGEQSHLPLAARKAYTFQSQPSGGPNDRRAAWNRALSGAAGGKLADAVQAFDQITKSSPTEAAAWYNLALTRAWLGDNRAALEALDQYVHFESDEQRAGEAWALAEVLRFGQGMEDAADYVEHSAAFQIRDMQALLKFLDVWQRERRLTGIQVSEEEGMVSGVVLEQTGLLTAGPPTKPAKLAAYLLILGPMLVLRSTNNDALDRARRDLQQRAGPVLSEPRLQRGPANFGDVLAEALVFPGTAISREDAQRQIRDHVQQFFEETWVHRPLKSLLNVPPLDAAGHKDLRKKLRGVVLFLEQNAAGPTQAYEFDRLRRKLGLLGGEVAAAETTKTTSAPAPDLDAMGATELAALPLESLTDNQLEQAHHASQRLDAHELASRFAKTLIRRPVRPDRPDRYPLYSYLVQRSLTEGDAGAALGYVDEGEKSDCEQNEGRRRNDYELRRGQVLTKKGDVEAAKDTFERLIARSPDELRYTGSAAESMLTLKNGALALQFAVQGLSKARAQNNRDSEQYFMELVSAARRQSGS
jgi:tetratricopeptide (TPR) repeat protein